MKTMRRIGAGFGLLLMLLPLLTGCSGGATVSQGGLLKGTITVSGAWALYPMMVRWGEEFTRLHPQVQFDISAGGAGKGMTDALTGAVDIGMVSRDIAPEEEAKGAFWIPVTKDAVFPAVNAQNPVLQDLLAKGVTREMLVGIYITGDIVTWGQVVGRPEVTDSIHVYTRSDAAGAPDVWAKYLGKKQENLLGIGVTGDPGLADAVVKDRFAIGYNNLNYAFDPNSGQAVAGAVVPPLDANGDGQADAGEVLETKAEAVAAVKSGQYPSPPARLLHLVTKGKPTGVTQAFLEWIVGDGQQYLGEIGYVPLTPEQVTAARARLE
jgi:phosphate transport system substrate-binding protein